MKRLIVFFLFSLCLYTGYAQSVVEHVVQRGETFASIAKKYGIDEDKLKSDNAKYKTCYAGLKLQIIKPDSSDDDSENDFSTEVDELADFEGGAALAEYLQSQYQDAREQEMKGKYGKAISIYDKIIKVAPSTQAYYLRGCAKFNNGNYRSSIKDLSKVQFRSDCSESMKNSCSSLIAQAEAKREEIHARNAAIISSAVTVLAVTATTAASIASNSYSSSASAYDSSGILTDNISGSSGSGYSSSKPKASERCRTCYGSGKCSSKSARVSAKTGCHGSGKCGKCGGTRYVSSFGTYDKCTFCNGSGLCRLCGGTGKCKDCHGTGYKA